MIFQSLPTSHSFRALPGPTTRRPNLARPIATVVFIFCFFFTLSFLKTSTPASTSALSTDGFKAGNIMNDYTMGNYTTMSEADIQAWLTQKNPCNNTNYATYQQLTNKYKDRDPSVYSWHWQPDDPKKPEKGHFVCLSEETFGEGKEIAPAEGGETAARIIYQAAQDYKINPQVFLVLLQKEMSLITDDIPRSGQYNSATGYGCTDSAPCFSQYAGFKNQIRGAAYLFRMSLDGKSSMYPIGKNYVQYNKDKSCGGSEIIIENYATSALYRYTPYQPNAAALAAGTGLGNACSAYGNRNFYVYFTQWFGSTHTSPWEALKTPRYYTAKDNIARINPITGEDAGQSVIAKGTILYFTSRTQLDDGTWCYRTEHNTTNDVMACVAESQIKTITLQYEDVPEAEQYKIINSGTVKITIDTKQKAQALAASYIRRFPKKAKFLGTTYYFTEYDLAKDKNTLIGIPAAKLTDISYTSISEWYSVNNDHAAKTSLAGDEVDVPLDKGTTRLFKTKIELADATYYQTEYDVENDLVNAISSQYLADAYSGYVSFQNPRALRLTKTVKRIDPITGKYYDTLNAGRVIEFSEKIYLNGQWYYRTKHNATNGLYYAIPASATAEI